MQPNAFGTAPTHTVLIRPVAGSGVRFSVARLVTRWLGELGQWAQRQRERAALAALDERMLKDIGVSRADVWQEINKPFWRR